MSIGNAKVYFYFSSRSYFSFGFFGMTQSFRQALSQV